MTNILITGIGGDIAQAAASIVKQTHPDWRLVGVDMDSRHGGRLFVDHFEIMPPANSDSFIRRLEELVERYNIDFCLPMSEAELSVLARNGIESIGRAQLLWAGKKAIEVCCDKLETAQFVRSLGIAVPWTLPASADVNPLSFPCLFKLRNSAGSKAVFICNTIEEVHFFRARYPSAVVQEYLPDADQEITCAVYRSKSGVTQVLQMRRRLVGGFTGWAEIVEHSAVTEQCVTIAEALDLLGPINIQLRMTPDGPRIFEINPRLSSTILMRHLVGFTDLLWMVNEALGLPIIQPKESVGTVLVRTQGAAVVPS